VTNALEVHMVYSSHFFFFSLLLLSVWCETINLFTMQICYFSSSTEWKSFAIICKEKLKALVLSSIDNCICTWFLMKFYALRWLRWYEDSWGLLVGREGIVYIQQNDSTYQKYW
jgi:hypothetical protein